ncbi:MAG TPA: DNA-primase RepB domain-containing protein, partial [Dehalococcoidia bacterium]|nr:DNA-primase RepB domain-containing protein [Dehalococcoidia bacterium]
MADAERLFDHVFRGVPGGGTIALFSGVWDHATRRLTDIRDTQRATYPQAAGFAADWLAAEARAGREAYACAHLLTGKRRIAANAAQVHALWTDSDGAQPPAWLPAPTAIVQSSPGRHYHFWRLTRAIAPAAAADLNRRLAYAMGADTGGWDLSQVLRWPDTLHGKTATRHPVRLVALDDDRAVDPDELDRVLPPAPAAATAGEPLVDDADEPPVVLAGRDLETWRGQRPVMKPDGAIDRSETLYKIAAVLHAAGATRRTVTAALRERDGAFDWNKYADRPGEYDRIAAKIAGTPRPPGAAPDRAPCGERVAQLERRIAQLERRCERYRRFAVARGD